MPVQIGHEPLDPPVVRARVARCLRHRRPEPDIDVQLARPHRVQRPGVAGPDRAEPDRRDPDVGVERFEERRQVLHRDLDVLHHRLLHRSSAQRVEPVAPPVAPVERHDPPVDVRPPVPAGPQPSHEGVLYPDRARTPEPVGVPAPEVVADGEMVDRPLLLRPVEDLLPGVVARGDAGRQLVDELAGRQVLLTGVEDGPVEEVDRAGSCRKATFLQRGCVKVAFLQPQARQLGEGRGARGGVRVAAVAQPHVRPHRLQVDHEAQGVTQRAVGVGEAPVQVGVLAVRRRRDHLAGAGEDLHLPHRLVRQAVPERRRLDAQPGHRAAQGDGLELRDDQGHQAVRERRVDQVLIGRHARDVRGPGDRVHGDHAGQAGGVEGRGRARNRNRFELGLPSRTRVPGGSSR